MDKQCVLRKLSNLQADILKGYRSSPVLFRRLIDLTSQWLDRDDEVTAAFGVTATHLAIRQPKHFNRAVWRWARRHRSRRYLSYTVQAIRNPAFHDITIWKGLEALEEWCAVNRAEIELLTIFALQIRPEFAEALTGIVLEERASALISFWGDAFQSIGREEFGQFEDELKWYFENIEALRPTKFEVVAILGEPTSDPNTHRVEVEIDGVPVEPLPGTLIIPGFNDDILQALRSCIEICLDHLCPASAKPALELVLSG